MPLKKRRLERLQGGDQLLGGDEEGDRQVERTWGIDIGRPAWMAEAQLWTRHAAIAEARNEVCSFNSHPIFQGSSSKS